MKSNYKINEEQLLKYLNGSLNNDELHEFEKNMAESNLLNDAVEGLQNIKNNETIETHVLSLNSHLHQLTLANKKRKHNNKKPQIFWIIIAIVFIVLICFISFLLITKIF